MINKNFIGALFLSLMSVANLIGSIKFNSQSSALALDQTNSGLTLSTSMPITYGTLKLRNTTGTTDGNVASATGAETITFTDGSVKLGTTTVDLTGGTYDPKTGSTRDSLSLGNGQVMSVSAGTTIFNDVAVANGATATILGCPTFVSSVSLGNSSSVLNLAIQNKLNKDIVLNSGKLVLQDNLELADGVRIWGTGTVDINYQSLRFGTQVNSSVFSQDLTFWRAKDITLNGPVTLAGNWSFLTNSTDNESVINGNGNILTLAGGNLVVGDATAGHTLYINDLIINSMVTSGQIIPGSVYTVPGNSLASYNSSYGSSTQATAAYNAGFVWTGLNSNIIAIYDGTETTGASPRIILSTGGGYFQLLSVATGYPLIFADNTGDTVNFSGGLYSLDIDLNGLGIAVGFSGLIYAGFGSGSYLYYSSTSPTVKLCSTLNLSSNKTFLATSTQVFSLVINNTSSSTTTLFSGGYNNIQGIAGTNDNYVWVLDKDSGGVNHLYRTNGSTSTTITLPNNLQPASIAVKGSSTNVKAVCGTTNGHLLFSTDGLNFYDLGDFGVNPLQNCTAVGARGSVAFANTSGAIFMISPFQLSPINQLFSLYDSSTDANRGKVILSNVTLEMAGNYTHSAGHITFKGDNCKIISGGNKTFTISGSNAPVEVDSVALTYDTLAGTNTSPFTGTAVTLTNGGTVRSASQPGETIIDANLYNGSSAPTLIQNYSLSQKNGGVTVTNSTGASSQTVTINGGNYFWDFPGGTTTVLTIADKVTVTLTNVILKNFSLSNVSFGGASAALVFGDGCVIELGADQSLTTGQGAWLFSGNATIRGIGQTITLNNTDSIRQNVANKTLTISNTILKSLTTLSLGCASLGKIVLSNSTLQINTGGFTWSTGNLDISGYSKLSSMNITTSGGSANFNLTTSGQMTVTSGSTLEFGRAISFAYSPTTTGDTGGITGTIAKRHFALGASGDASATLYASNCSIDSTAVGMALDRGNLVINNKVVLTASSTASYESELGSALNVELLAESLFRIDGGIKYTITTV